MNGSDHDRFPAPAVPRINVLGVMVSATTMDEAAAAALAAAAAGGGGYICLTGVHGIMESRRDPALRQIHNRSLLTLPDGMPTVWLGAEAGFLRMDRVYGPDFMLELLRRTSGTAGGDGRNARHFLYGSTPETLARLTDQLRRRFPGVCIAGSYSPPFRPLTEAEWDHLRTLLDDARPDFVWVGLSTPKQERFMAEFQRRVSGVRCQVSGPEDDGAAGGRGPVAGGTGQTVNSLPAVGLAKAGEQLPVTAFGGEGTRRPTTMEINPTSSRALSRASSADKVCDKARDKGPTLPRQHRRPILLGVGAAFDIHAGLKADAPDWMKQAGLQWLHRLCQEPRRLWKRYLFIVPTFLVLVLAQLLGLKKFQEDV